MRSPAVILYDASGNPITVEQDGSVYRLQGATKVQRESDGAFINPATQETLAAADSRLATIDAVLDAIKDTEGVKRITDALPAGTNEIGKVAQGTKAAGTGAWPQYLVDSDDGSAVTVTSGRLHVTAEVDWTGLRIGRLEHPTYGSDMVQDGSVGSIDFSYDADATHDLTLISLRVVFVPNVLKFKGETFGAMPALTNGVVVSVTHDNGTTVTMGTVKISEDWLFLGHPTMETQLNENDLLVVELPLSGSVVLKAGTSDKVNIRIQDDIQSQGANSTKYLQATVYARESS